MSAENACPVCSSSGISAFFEVSGAPVQIGLQWPSQEAARRCPKGDIRLGFCRDCGFITNLAFEPARLEYTPAYDNSLHFSPFFKAYARSEALRLIERHNLYDKDVIEIGCGKGDFLSLLCELGNNRGVGFDPGGEHPHPDPRVTLIRDFYSGRYASHRGDLICCRHVFEHVHNPTDFLRTLRFAIGDRLSAVVYFEVPNVSPILRDLSVWDVIYEHCSYFSRESLARAFALCGFRVYDLAETYEGQYLRVEALPCKEAVDLRRELKAETRDVSAFADDCRGLIEAWRSYLDTVQQAGQRVVLWGAGAKGVSFMNMLKGQGWIEYVVDINPRKQGRYVAGTGQRIVPPEFLRDYRPGVIIVMNPVYQGEIQRMTERLGVTAEFRCA
ncbi:MAG: methyltransferase [Candidatus Handelsmanbacteria bacterium RIFCSPLOWO2_12_FULL_64_10]|uniref:Methyltransferase n=1 Tax=Handelsmanbacteria sp. (strain RIFCSPLOWO2_12_FULL_64_10) TaxID=1817868 RepID=A0A1F6C619_HANXR|nr:MAG: methyltransferase [Candidatus Handelsmanbacteria bacterium RIFCSPLOWO2_12_FULL_64_10]